MTVKCSFPRAQYGTQRPGENLHSRIRDDGDGPLGGHYFF